MKAKFFVPVCVFVTAVVVAFLLVKNPQVKPISTVIEPTSTPIVTSTINAPIPVTNNATAIIPVTTGTCKIPLGHTGKVASDKNSKYIIGLVNYPQTPGGDNRLISYETFDGSTLDREEVSNPSPDFRIDFFTITATLEDQTVVFTYPQEGRCVIDIIR